MGDQHAAEVQAELQQYLNSKNINSLFIQIVESLLIEKPDNPIAFMVEYLLKQYPNETKELQHGLSTTDDTAFIKAETKAESKDDNRVEGMNRIEEKMGVDDIHLPSIEAAPAEEKAIDLPLLDEQPVGLVDSESAEPVAESKSSIEVADAAIMSSEEAHEELSSVMALNAHLRDLPAYEMDRAAKAFSGPHFAEEGVLLAEGSTCSSFYLVASGQFTEGLVEHGKGSCFGECSLLQSTPTKATVRATVRSMYFIMGKEEFLDILGAYFNARNEKRMTALGRAPILGTLTDDEMYLLAHYAVELNEDQPRTLCSQGQRFSSLFVVVLGSLECYQVDAEGVELHLATLGEGDCFGEASLLSEKPCLATVRTPGATRLLHVDMSVLTNRVGSLESLLKRNMEVYAKYIGADN